MLMMFSSLNIRFKKEDILSMLKDFANTPTVYIICIFLLSLHMNISVEKYY